MAEDTYLTRNTFLKPRPWAFDYLGLVTGQHALKGILSEELQADHTLRILDFGCGSSPWKLLFQPYAREYVGLDIKPGPNVDVVASAEDMPLEEGAFDVVFSMAALEHIRDYRATLSETHRVLKPDGLAVIGVPFIWEIHGEPHDYWRWTPNGILESFVDFSSCRVVQVGNAMTNYLLVQNIFLHRIQDRFYRLRRLLTPFILLNNIVGRACGAESKGTVRMTTFYFAVARK